MTEIAISRSKVPIRLMDERWHHITTGHPEMADYYYEILDTIENPAIIYKGNFEGKIAIGNPLNERGKFIVVIYKEMNINDGFVITAYITEMADDEIIVRYENNEIIGLSVLNASKRTDLNLSLV